MTISSRETTAQTIVETGHTVCDYVVCAPKCCQRFRKPHHVLFWLSWANFIHTMIVAGYIYSVITTLERRFHLSSKESGMIMSFVSIGGLLLLTPLSDFVTFSRRLRLYSYGLLLFSISYVLFALPHFITGPYRYRADVEPICYKETNISYGNLCDEDEPRKPTNYYTWIFWACQMGAGIGSSARVPLGTAYLNDNTPAKYSALYLKILNIVKLTGPTLGFVLAFVVLQYSADIGRPHQDFTNVDKSEWIGAWWLGFLISGSLALIAVIPLFGFPHQLPGTSGKDRNVKKDTIDTRNGSQLFSDILLLGHTDFIKNAKKVATNLTFVFICCSIVVRAILTSGLSAFTPKFLEVAFGFSPPKAVIICGLVVIPSYIGGTLSGEMLVRRFGLMRKLLILISVVPLTLISFCFFLCESAENIPPWAGLTDSNTNNSKKEIHNSCNANCKCKSSRLLFAPVCGTDHQSYFSPCYAGCSTVSPAGFFNCSCISNSEAAFMPDAVRGSCMKSCSYMPLFLVLMGLSTFFLFSLTTPSLLVTTRCVPQSQKSFVIGVQIFMVRLFGFIPGPIVFGAIFDSTCVLWFDSCGRKEHCAVYDSVLLLKIFIATFFSLQLISTIFCILSWISYKCKPKTSSEVLHPHHLSKHSRQYKIWLRGNQNASQ